MSYGDEEYGEGAWSGGGGAPPTVVEVQPSEGHTGGETLVAVLGTGFRLQLSAAPTVRVLFGELLATSVQVVSGDLLYCKSPEHDEVVVETPLAFITGSATISATAHPFAIGEALTLAGSGAPARPPPPFEPKRAYWVRAAAANTLELAETAGGPALAPTGAATGTVVARTVGAVDVTVQNLDDVGEPIEDELVVALAAFRFRRPDLSSANEGTLARVLRALIQRLKRRIHPNVSFTTSTDYDPDTGDMLNVTLVQELPALVLSDVEIEDDPEYQPDTDVELEADEARFIARRPAEYVRATMALVGVTDNPIVHFNLFQAVRLDFRKSSYVEILRVPGDASFGSVRFHVDLRPVAIPIRAQADNSNVLTWTAQLSIRGIPLEDIPGLSEEKPAGIPAHFPHEATTEFGWTAEEGSFRVIPK